MKILKKNVDGGVNTSVNNGEKKNQFFENNILLFSRQNYIILMDIDVFWINMITISRQNDQTKNKSNLTIPNVLTGGVGLWTHYSFRF